MEDHLMESLGPERADANGDKELVQGKGGQVLPLVSQAMNACERDTANPLKSCAVVKYQSILKPVPFYQLQINTDLNEPPSNWLRAHSEWESHIRDFSTRRRHQFASFKMAHCYPDLTGELDVVSDSENIKKLLKIPYSKAPVSMMVHRVSNTLLLDEFDIHNHLLRQQKEDWHWMRKFYEETVLRDTQKGEHYVVKKNKSRNQLQDRNLLSKFLYYSVPPDEMDSQQTRFSRSNSLDKLEPSGHSNLPEPLPLPEPEKFEEHHRVVKWTFEDIDMLIGTDLPIFGDGKRPCVSLRLRDMEKPINVLTGLDYWLDNLMCNVPDIAMCYHLNGIVQSYELMTTEDIPKMNNSSFSPQVVKDVAQNILSFLKSNATKEGHTYWLFKGQGDDVVKLYDLSTLCSDLEGNPNINPFTVPVGVLLYRVARNMRQRCGRGKSATIRKLLDSCLKLLDPNIHSQVVTSAHYLLSDLFTSDDIDNIHTDPSQDDDSQDDDSDLEGDQQVNEDDVEFLSDSDEGCSSVEVKKLSLPETVSKPSPQSVLLSYPPVVGDVAGRGLQSLEHIAQGLACLDKCVATTIESRSKESQAFRVGGEAIPLHYKPLFGKDNSQSNNGKAQTETETESENKPSLLKQEGLLPKGSWHVLSKTLLLRKAAIVYYGLAENETSLQRYDHALTYIKLGLHCFSAMESLLEQKGRENQRVLVVLLGLAGDLHLMHSRSASTTGHHGTLGDSDNAILCSAELESRNTYVRYVQEGFTQDDNLRLSISCYNVALSTANQIKDTEVSGRTQEVIKRLGNAHNELGVFLMNSLTKVIQDHGIDCALAHKLLLDSEASLDAGMQHFSDSKDFLNQALLLANKGRLMRLCAQGHAALAAKKQDSRREMSAKEKHFYQKAESNYMKALKLLDHRTTENESIWDSMSWELSTVCFTIASTLQDHPPLSSLAQEQVESEVIEYMKRSEHWCGLEWVSAVRKQTCQYRAACIHHRLASLNHNILRNQVRERAQKEARQLAEKHYSEAFDLFLCLETPCELLRVQLERVALCENILCNQTSSSNRQQTLSTALEHILVCQEPISTHFDAVQPSTNLTEVDVTSGDGKGPHKDAKNDEQEAEEELVKLLGILLSRVQFILLSLVKCLSSSHSKHRKTKNRSLDVFKTMYAKSLQSKSHGEDDCRSIVQMLGEIKQCYENYKTEPS